MSDLDVTSIERVRVERSLNRRPGIEAEINHSEERPQGQYWSY
jgi:hypothetical protein